MRTRASAVVKSSVGFTSEKWFGTGFEEGCCAGYPAKINERSEYQKRGGEAMRRSHGGHAPSRLPAQVTTANEGENGEFRV
jgi:hypothetical protein